MLFNFIDEGMPKRYSSKRELKSIAMKFAAKCQMSDEVVGIFLLKVDIEKSNGKFSDAEVLLRAFKAMSAK